MLCGNNHVIGSIMLDVVFRLDVSSVRQEDIWDKIKLALRSLLICFHKDFKISQTN